LPSVAVIMPVFNSSPQFLKEAIDSIVVNQTYRGPITLVIINDGSTSQRTVQYLESVEQMNPRKIRVFTLDENRGIAEALNRGMQVAFEIQADFIARMDSDDVSVSQRIETQINYFLRNPEIDIVGSNILMFNEQNRSLASSKVMSYPTMDKLIKFNMLFHCCLVHPSVMFRAQSIGSKLQYNTEDPDVRAFEDYELWLRLIHSPEPPKFANIGSILLLLRKHGSNTSAGVSLENEIPMKVNILSNYYINGDLRDAL